MNGTEAETSVLRLGIIKKQIGWNVNIGLQRKAEIPEEIIERQYKKTENRHGLRTYSQKTGCKYTYKRKSYKRKSKTHALSMCQGEPDVL